MPGEDLNSLNAPSAGDLLGATPRKPRAKTNKANGIYEDQTTPVEIPPKRRYEQRRNLLDIDRQSWRSHWVDLCDHFLPRRGKWLQDYGKPNSGIKRHGKVIDNCPILSARTLSSGLMAGMTSPARPWFMLQTEDPDLMHAPGVREWLDDSTRRMRQVFARSNVYNALAVGYKELGVFGTMAIGVFESQKFVINCVPYTAGSYWIAQNPEGTVDTFYRLFKWTVRQLVMEFVTDPNDPNSEGWENIAPSTLALWKQRNWDTWIELVHAIEANVNYRPGQIGKSGKAVSSCYYERGGTETQLLRERGFRLFPVLVSRWETNEEDVYGSSPAMDCLGDARALMLQQKRKAQAIDKHVDPPMTADPEMERQRVSMLPGDVTYVPGGANAYGFKPAYQVKPETHDLLLDIEATTKRIDAAMYRDIFQMLTLMGDKSGITATEIAARQQEKLLMLGPVLDRLNRELLNPLIDRTFDVMVERSKPSWNGHSLEAPLLRAPPSALNGKPLKVEYVSILAQAMKVAQTQGLQMLTDYAGKVAQIQAEAAGAPVLDKINFDEAIEDMADALGVAPKVVVSDDQVKEVRAQRQQQQAEAQQHEQMMNSIKTGAEAAQSLSQTPVGDASALEHLAGMAPQGNA